MNITEEKVSYLTNKPPDFKKIIYPKPILKHVPNLYFVMCAIGERGQGKSYSVVRMLSNMWQSGYICPQTGEKCAMRTILFTPTIEGNPIFKTLKSLDDDDIHNDFSEELLSDVLEEIKAEKKNTENYWDYVEAYKQYEKMSQEQFKKWTDIDAILMLESNDFAHYNKIPKPKHPNGCVCTLILDDLLANKEAFNNKRGSLLLKSVLNGRHMGINVVFCGQNMKSISKPIRLNTSIWVLFRFKSKKILLQDLYPEISSLVNEDQFLEIYSHATKEDHDALVIDNTEPLKEHRFKKNFDVILKFKNDENSDIMETQTK